MPYFVVMPMSHHVDAITLESSVTLSECKRIREWSSSWTTPNNLEPTHGFTETEAINVFASQGLAMPVDFNKAAVYAALRVAVTVYQFDDEGRLCPKSGIRNYTLKLNF